MHGILRYLTPTTILIVMILSTYIYGQRPLSKTPGNLDFDADQPGQSVSVWQLSPGSASSGYTFTSSDGKPFAGGLTGILQKDATQPGGMPGIVTQSFDATAFRGKRVRFRAAVRTENGGAGQAQLWFRVDKKPIGSQPEIGFFDNMDDRPIKSDQWASYDIIGDVSAEAEVLNIGLIMIGSGKTWVDAGSFEILGDAEPLITEPARAITERGLNNVTVFARLMGYVRHFHPSDQAAQANWESFTIKGMREVEPAGNSAELAKKLTELFKPLAPTVAISANGKIPSPASITMPPASATKALVWLHRGYGVKNRPGPYSSTRVDINFVAGRLPATAPASFIADLGSGVTAMIPLVIYADAKGTLPQVKEFVTAPAVPLPTKPGYTANDRATRLADVALAWNVLEHFYPYFEETRIDWMPVLPSTLKLAATAQDEREFEKALNMMVARLNDGHGGVGFKSAGLYGAPVSFDWIDGKLIVTSVADKITGIHPGDAVIAIDGQPTEQALREKEALISSATPQWKSYRAKMALMGGAKDSVLNLEIEPQLAPSQPVKVSLVRDTPSYTVTEKRPNKISEIEPGIFYVNLDQISNGDFNEILPKLEQARSIIIDMRGYPKLEDPFSFFSHLSEQPLTSARFLIPVITHPDHQAMQFQGGGEWQIKPAVPYLKAKKVFITDGRAISYAESVMGIVEAYKLGEIVGSATAGTNGDVNPLELPGDYRINWTGMKVQKHDGTPHHGVGILPTVPVKRTREGVAAGKDELLDKALEIAKR